jgi:hypothetical protein
MLGSYESNIGLLAIANQKDINSIQRNRIWGNARNVSVSTTKAMTEIPSAQVTIKMKGVR